MHRRVFYFAAPGSVAQKLLSCLTRCSKYTGLWGAHYAANRTPHFAGYRANRTIVVTGPSSAARSAGAALRGGSAAIPPR